MAACAQVRRNARVPFLRVTQARHCVVCQPHGPVIDVSCSCCGNGPLITGQLPELGDQLTPRAYALSGLADAAVFTGLFYRDQIARYYRANGLPEPYGATARRKI